MSLRQLSLTPPAVGAYTPDGAFTNWITLNAPGTRNTNGGNNAATAFGSCWAAIRALSGQELFKAQQIAQTVTQLVTVKYQTGITENMTITLADGRVFQIRSIQDPYNTKVELRILCDEPGQNAGQS